MKFHRCLLALLGVVALVAGQSHFDDEADDPLYAFTQHEEVSQKKLDRLDEIYVDFLSRSHLKEQDPIAALIDRVSEDSIRSILNTLTGFTTRNSNSVNSPSGINHAANFSQGQMAKFGFDSKLDPFRSGFGPNVISEKLGTTRPTEIVVVGAHLDDRNANINDFLGRAPGANDDGSGSAAMLEIGRVISESGVNFASTVRIGLWGGEEQGLIGSRDYARRMREQQANIIAMIQADMIGVRNTSRYPLPQLDLVSLNVNTQLTSQVRTYVTSYVPSSELTVGSTTACCSDHQSFVENGFPSAGFVEGGGYTIDPQYHRVGDVVDRIDYDVRQIALHTKGILASLATIAGLQ